MRTGRRKILTLITAILVFFTIALACADALPFTTVYILKTGVKRYHRHGCVTVRHGAVAISVSNAKERGYAPCPRCKPPSW